MQATVVEPLRWIAINTRTHHEKRVAQQLQTKSIEVFLPLYHCRHKWSNGVHAELSLPFFPCYLFGRVTSQHRLAVLQLPGVVGLAASNARPTAIPDDEIDSLRAAVETVGAEPHPFVNIGERVRINAGALAGLEGILIRRKQELRVVLTVNLIMRSISIEVNEFEIERVSSPLLHSYSHRGEGVA